MIPESEIWGVAKLVGAGMAAWIARDLNNKLKTLIVKVDLLVEAQTKTDIHFERHDVEMLQMTQNINDNKKSLAKAWNSIRRLQGFAKAVKTSHNANHPNSKINGVEL